jgi:ribosomal protein S30
MTFDNQSFTFSNCAVELVYCCDEHGKVPKEEISMRHSQTKELTSKEKHNLRRRDRRKYVCITCKVVFQNSGSWKKAKQHWQDSKDWGQEHAIIKGDLTGKYVLIYGAVGTEK